MLEFIVLGLVPGTDIQLTFQMVLYAFAGLFGIATSASYIGYFRRRNLVKAYQKVHVSAKSASKSVAKDGHDALAV